MSAQPSSSSPEQDARQKALNTYRRKLLEHREMEAKVKERKSTNDCVIYAFKLFREAY